MARNVPIIELKYHDNFNLIEPGFVDKCKQSIEDYYQVYYGVLNDLVTLQNASEGALLLKGHDFLTEKLSELEADMREITSVCNNIHNMGLYKDAVDKRNEILDTQQGKIQSEKNNAQEKKNWAQKELDSKFFNGPASPFHQELWDKINSADKTIAECDEDLAIIDKLRGKDYNEY